VISPELCAEIEDLFAAGRIMTAKRPYADGDLAGAFVVIAATDDVVVNKKVADEAEKRRILVNVVDVSNMSNFIVPSYLRRGDLTVAVSTGGRSPALARRIKEELETNIGEEYALLTSMVGQVRSSVKQDSIVVSGDDWQASLDLDVLVKLLREDRYDEAKQMLADVLRRPK
jgi:siroheme synthase-like protein